MQSVVSILFETLKLKQQGFYIFTMCAKRLICKAVQA